MIIERSDSTFVRSSTPSCEDFIWVEDATLTTLSWRTGGRFQKPSNENPTGPATGSGDADVRELAIHRRVSRMSYSRRCAEASAVKAYQKSGLSLAPGMEIGYVVRDAAKWEIDTERDASEFDAGYYRKLLETAWEEAGFIFYSQLSRK